MYAQAGSPGGEDGAPVDGLPLFNLILQISRELNENAVAVVDFQTVISELGPDGLSNSVIESLQAVDLLSQTLVEISHVLKRAAGSCPADLRLPDSFLENVKLSALRDRLAGKASDPATQNEPELW